MRTLGGSHANTHFISQKPQLRLFLLLQKRSKKAMKFKEALENYFNRVSIIKKGVAQERFRIQQLSRSFLGELEVLEINSVHIATYRDERLGSLNMRTQKKISPATVRLELSLLSNFFEIARTEWGLCDDNPVKKVRKPKTPPGRDRRLTPREERKILRYCQGQNNIELLSIVVFAVETAMRQGEILGLCWENVNLSQRVATLHETKNGTKRDVPLTLLAREMLLKMGARPEGRIFTYTSNGLKSTWRFMLQKLLIEDLHFHDLRHEAVSRLFEKGTLDMMEISAISGHKSLSMLKRYTHLKAHKLVRKLEAPRNQGRAAVLSNFVPYPVQVKATEGKYTVRLLDFDGVQVEAANLPEAIERAQTKLIRLILLSMKQSRPLPPPDQYLDAVPYGSLLMIDPLSEAMEEVC